MFRMRQRRPIMAMMHAQLRRAMNPAYDPQPHLTYGGSGWHEIKLENGTTAYLDMSKFQQRGDGRLVYQLPDAQGCDIASGSGGGVVYLCCYPNGEEICVPLPITVGPLPESKPGLLLKDNRIPTGCWAQEHGGVLHICCSDSDLGVHCVPLPIVVGTPSAAPSPAWYASPRVPGTPMPPSRVPSGTQVPAPGTPGTSTAPRSVSLVGATRLTGGTRAG